MKCGLCGETVQPWERFCGSCGARVSGARPADGDARRNEPGPAAVPAAQAVPAAEETFPAAAPGTAVFEETGDGETRFWPGMAEGPSAAAFAPAPEEPETAAAGEAAAAGPARSEDPRARVDTLRGGYRAATAAWRVTAALAVPLCALYLLACGGTELMPILIAEAAFCALITAAGFFRRGGRAVSGLFAAFFLFCTALTAELYAPLMGVPWTSYLRSWGDLALRNTVTFLTLASEVALLLAAAGTAVAVTVRGRTALRIVSAGTALGLLALRCWYAAEAAARIAAAARATGFGVWKTLGGYYFVWHSMILVVLCAAWIFFCLSPDAVHPKKRGR